jgi:peptide/nickel transport system substrate-binding protein
MSLLSRRDFLHNSAKGGLVLGAGGLIAACGSSSPGSASSAASSSSAGGGAPKHGGTLHAGITGGSSSDTVDPNLLLNNTDYARVQNMYDSLVWLTPDAKPYFRLAEEMTPNKDATVWTIRLRKGVTFHNGKECTADDLIYSITRVVNPKSPGVAANALTGINVKGIKKLDSHTITVPFASPYATLVETLANSTTVFIIPTDFNPKKPIGTGPFKLTSFTPGQQTILSRNENYWDSPRPYLDKIIMTDFADETSQVNALLSGQVDVVNLLSQDVIGTVTGSGKNVVIAPGGGWNPFTMRVNAAPFTDVRVRQAFRLAVDRPKMLQIVFGGHGTIGNDVFGIWSADYDHSLPQRHYDPEQAKSLLKQAGHENLSIELVTADIAQGATNMAQVFAQSASAAGISVKLRKITVTEFYGPNYLKWVFAQDFWYYQPYFAQVNQATLPGSPYNETHFANPRYISLYKQAQATLDVAKRTQISHEMQMIDYNEGGYIIPFFPAVIDGYAPKVHGIVKSKLGASLNSWDFEHMWLA